MSFVYTIFVGHYLSDKENLDVQNAAVKGLKHFIHALHASDNKGTSDLTVKYLNMLTDPNVAARRGSALAIGVLPYELLASQWRNVLLKLCSCCTIEVLHLVANVIFILSIIVLHKCFPMCRKTLKTEMLKRE